MRQNGRIDRGPIGVAQAIDTLDRRLIEVLQEHGRESFRNIGRLLDVSEATIRNRYQRLVDANVLQVTGITNPLGVGFESMAMIGVKTSAPALPIAEEIASWEEVSYVVVTVGRYDLLVEVVCVTRKQLVDVTERLRGINGVAATETFGYLDLVKQVVDWGVPLHESNAREVANGG